MEALAKLLGIKQPTKEPSTQIYGGPLREEVIDNPEEYKNLKNLVGVDKIKQSIQHKISNAANTDTHISVKFYNACAVLTAAIASNQPISEQTVHNLFVHIGVELSPAEIRLIICYCCNLNNSFTSFDSDLLSLLGIVTDNRDHLNIKVLIDEMKSNAANPNHQIGMMYLHILKKTETQENVINRNLTEICTDIQAIFANSSANAGESSANTIVNNNDDDVNKALVLQLASLIISAKNDDDYDLPTIIQLLPSLSDALSNVLPSLQNVQDKAKVGEIQRKIADVNRLLGQSHETYEDNDLILGINNIHAGLNQLYNLLPENRQKEQDSNMKNLLALKQQISTEADPLKKHLIIRELLFCAKNLLTTINQHIEVSTAHSLKISLTNQLIRIAETTEQNIAPDNLKFIVPSNYEKLRSSPEAQESIQEIKKLLINNSNSFAGFIKICEILMDAINSGKPVCIYGVEQLVDKHLPDLKDELKKYVPMIISLCCRNKTGNYWPSKLSDVLRSVAKALDQKIATAEQQDDFEAALSDYNNTSIIKSPHGSWQDYITSIVNPVKRKSSASIDTSFLDREQRQQLELLNSTNNNQSSAETLNMLAGRGIN